MAVALHLRLALPRWQTLVFGSLAQTLRTSRRRARDPAEVEKLSLLISLLGQVEHALTHELIQGDQRLT